MAVLCLYGVFSNQHCYNIFFLQLQGDESHGIYSAPVIDLKHSCGQRWQDSDCMLPEVPLPASNCYREEWEY